MLQVQNISLVLISLSTVLTCGTFHVVARDNTVQNISLAQPYDSVQKESGYYRNGKIKFTVWSFYDRLQHNERKRLVEKFRKNGKRKYVRQYKITPDFEMLIVYEARYDPQGKLIDEGYYSYDRYGILIQDETQ